MITEYLFTGLVVAKHWTPTADTKLSSLWGENIKMCYLLLFLLSWIQVMLADRVKLFERIVEIAQWSVFARPRWSCLFSFPLVMQRYEQYHSRKVSIYTSAMTASKETISTDWIDPLACVSCQRDHSLAIRVYFSFPSRCFRSSDQYLSRRMLRHPRFSIQPRVTLSNLYSSFHLLNGWFSSE